MQSLLEIALAEFIDMETGDTKHKAEILEYFLLIEMWEMMEKLQRFTRLRQQQELMRQENIPDAAVARSSD